MKKIMSLFLFVIMCFPCVPPVSAETSKEIIVSAAISLKNAFEEIGKLYERRNKETKVAFNFGASGDLMRQIEGGAPVDVFASAAQKDMDEAEKKGLLLAGSRTNFTANAVVLILPAAARTSIKSFEELKMEGIRKIAVGNPKTVPAGRYAEEVFTHFKVLDVLKDKLVLTENVRQALDYVARGEVDAGVVYATDALTRAKDVSVAAVAPEASHKPVVYPIAVVKGTKNVLAAKDFLAVVLSPEGQRILEKFGFKKL